MTTIVTEFGRFIYNRLPTGMCASEEISPVFTSPVNNTKTYLSIEEDWRRLPCSGGVTKYDADSPISKFKINRYVRKRHVYIRQFTATYGYFRQFTPT